MRQTKVTEQNRTEFIKTVYPALKEGPQYLVDISQETNDIIAIDCCGWYYHQVFQKKVIMLETLNTVKDFRLSREQYNKLIDNRTEKLVWPKLPNLIDPIVLLDRPLILKYQTMSEFKSLIQEIIERYNPVKIIIRGYLWFIDDSRLGDRLHNWFEFFPMKNYVAEKFVYDTTAMTYAIDLKRLS